MKTLNPVVIAKVKENIAAITEVIPRCDIRQQTRDLNMWEEVSLPMPGDRVYVYNVNNDEHEGTICAGCITDTYITYTVAMDDGLTIPVDIKNLRALYDRETAHYKKFWKFTRPADIDWLSTVDGLQDLCFHRFRVYQNNKGERIFGTDAETEDEALQQWAILLDAKRGSTHDLCNV